MDAALREYVLLRDGGCVARFANSPFWKLRWPQLQDLPEAGFCRDRYGSIIDPTDKRHMTLDHVKDEPGMSIRADDAIGSLWTVCWFHHIGTEGSRRYASQWATNDLVRAAARTYIDAANAAAVRRGWPVPPVLEVA